MKIFLILILFPIVNFSQETKTQIAEKLKPAKSKIVHSVIQQDIWGYKDAIIAFYETKFIDSLSTTHKYERQFVEAYLIIKKEEKYQKILIYKFEDDNVFTEISSVFFANTDQDSEKELLIMSTVEHRLQYLYEGVEYSTWVFDDLKSGKTLKELKLLENISQKLSGGFEGFSDGNGETKSKIKNAKDVKTKLIKLGY